MSGGAKGNWRLYPGDLLIQISISPKTNTWVHAASRGRSDLDDLSPNGKLNQVTVCAQIEFSHNAGTVRVHCFRTDFKRGRYFLITLAQCKKLQNLELARAEIPRGRSRFFCLCQMANNQSG